MLRPVPTDAAAPEGDDLLGSPRSSDSSHLSCTIIRRPSQVCRQLGAPDGQCKALEHGYVFWGIGQKRQPKLATLARRKLVKWIVLSEAHVAPMTSGRLPLAHASSPRVSAAPAASAAHAARYCVCSSALASGCKPRSAERRAEREFSSHEGSRAADQNATCT